MFRFHSNVFRLEPTAEDIAAAHAEIQTHEHSILSLQSQIDQLRRQIKHLEREQQRHHDGIRHCKGVLTLARRMPEELLSKIFEHCVEDGWTRAPIVVSHVCSAWRKAARAPRVWSLLYIDCDSQDVVDRLRFWLHKARQAPLDIRIGASVHSASTTIHNVMAQLRAHSVQWRTLSIDAQTVYEANGILEHCDARVPNLEELSIRTEIPQESDLEENDDDVDVLKNTFDVEMAPKLRVVDYSCNVVPLAPIFPTHIRDLQIRIQDSPAWRPLSARALMTILNDLPQLEGLTVVMPLVYEHQFMPELNGERQVTLPKLTSLTVYGPTDLNELLPHLHAPELRRLHLRSLEDLGYRQQPIGPSLLNFIESSAPPLELLELHDIDLSPDYFARSFRAMPALRELRLHESSIADSTVQLLHGPKGLCPRLTRLDFRWCGHLTGEALVDMVCSRNVAVPSNPGGEDNPSPAAPSPITEVAAINCCFVSEKAVLHLAQMTVCRVVMRDSDDYCRTKKCCDNVRYRTRLRMRHMAELAPDEHAHFRLLV